MVARCWGCERVAPPWKHREQDAGDHKGPPRHSSPPSPLRERSFPAWIESQHKLQLDKPPFLPYTTSKGNVALPANRRIYS